MRKTATILLISSMLLFSSAFGAHAQCTAYGNSHADPGSLPIGPDCEGTGDGCTECIDWNSGPGIWFTVCYYDWGGIYCYSYGWENQGL